MSAALSQRIVDPLRFEIVKTPARLAAVVQAWEALAARASAPIYRRPAWFVETLAARITTGSESFESANLVLAWDRADLVAIAPFATRRRGVVKVLGWLGEEHTDFCDVLIDPDLPADELTDRLWAETARAGGFDLASLSHLAADALAMKFGENAGPAMRQDGAGEPHLGVASGGLDGSGWLASISKKPRQNYHRGRKALAEMGEVGFRLLARDEPFEPMLDRLIQLKRDWQIRKEEPTGAFADDAAALRAAVRILHREDRLRVFVLECGGEPAAISLNFVEGNRMLAYLAAYDPRFERASVGYVLMAEYIQWSFDHGFTEVDFMSGGEDYKRRFANIERRLHRIVGSRTLLGAAAITARDLLARRGEGLQGQPPLD